MTRLALAGLFGVPAAAYAFCGFYVARADASLYNDASEVVLVRDGDHTTMTMANDYRGELSEFAVVIPLPVAVRKDQVTIGDMAMIDKLDAYSAPRLTEYFDSDPCARQYEYDEEYSRGDVPTAATGGRLSVRERSAADLGVRIEATYTVGEYDIVILSATQSTGLETWLHREGYNIPQGASALLGSYIRQNMKFFVAKVNLGAQRATGARYLRPLAVSYESPKFMLPIRLGMANAEGPQDLLVYAITRKGRVETTNYRTIKVPTGMMLPPFVKADFGEFYSTMFERRVALEGGEAVFTEYAWPLQVNCDPCSSDPVPPADLAALGARWVSPDGSKGTAGYLTRLHVRYDLEHFPEDLVFQETTDGSTFQAVYPIHHPFQGDTTCDAGGRYEVALADRQRDEVANLATLTGWSSPSIWQRMPRKSRAPQGGSGFWDW